MRRGGGEREVRERTRWPGAAPTASHGPYSRLVQTSLDFSGRAMAHRLMGGRADVAHEDLCYALRPPVTPTCYLLRNTRYVLRLTPYVLRPPVTPR